MKTGWIPSQSRVLDLGCGEGMLAIRDVVLEVSCFHNFKKVKERRLVAEKMHKVLRPGGKWMLVVKAFRDNKSDRSAETQWRIEMIEAACAGLFSLSHFDEADLKGPHMTSEMPGLAFNF